MHGRLLPRLVATWNYWINHKNRYAGLLALHLLHLLLRLIVEMLSISLSIFYRYYSGKCSSELAELVHFFIFDGGLLAILLD